MYPKRRSCDFLKAFRGFGAVARRIGTRNVMRTIERMMSLATSLLAAGWADADAGAERFRQNSDATRIGDEDAHRAARAATVAAAAVNASAGGPR
jgi:hypothetical protein